MWLFMQKKGCAEKSAKHGTENSQIQFFFAWNTIPRGSTLYPMMKCNAGIFLLENVVFFCKSLSINVIYYQNFNL